MSRSQSAPLLGPPEKDTFFRSHSQKLKTKSKSQAGVEAELESVVHSSTMQKENDRNLSDGELNPGHRRLVIHGGI